jgi:hypothetical protein
MTTVDNHDVEEYQLSEYELQRQERIRKNEAYLEKLGLMNAKNKLLKATTAPTKRNQQRRKKIPMEPSRRSNRLQRTSGTDQEGSSPGKDDLLMLSYYDDNDDARAVVPQGRDGPSASSSPSSVVYKHHYDQDDNDGPSASFRKVRKSIPNAADFQLTEEERAILARNTMDDNYLHKFKEFLVYHNKISEQNVRSVMKQITKLANGEGIHYSSPNYGWKPHQYFQKGNKITPLSDFVALMEEAAECEAKWGRDHGNGWLLSHPLKKMLLFQQFCLQNPDFLSTKSRLSTYYAEQNVDDDEEEGDKEDTNTNVTESESCSESSSSDDNTDKEESSPSPSPKKRRAVATRNESSPQQKFDQQLACKNPHLYVGCRVAKDFDGTVYFGTLVSYDNSSQFWQVHYDDDDAEDYNCKDLKIALCLYEKEGPRKKSETAKQRKRVKM